MSDFDNTNRGVLFNNKEKKSKDNDPDYSGSINFNGVDCWLNGWIKESREGKKFFSLSVRPKDQQARPVSQPTRKAAPMPDEDIPF